MNALIKCLAVASLMGFGFVAYDSTQDADRKQDAKPMGGPPMPQPTEEHKWLAEGAGKFKAVGKVRMGPDAWVPMSGVQTNTMQAGGFWQVIDFKDDAGQFAGNGLAGYDPAKKKFVSVWVDNMGTELAPAEGTLSADKKTLTMELMRTDESGKKVKITEIATRKDKDNAFFEMFQTQDGKQVKVLEITYTRM